MIIAPLNRSDMEANHARANGQRKKAITSPRTLKPWNVDVVLDLGNVIFFNFRGRPYGMPPLPWHVGQRLMALWQEATKYSGPLTEQTAPLYFDTVSRIPPILWKNCFPSSRFHRCLRWFGLLKNPFAYATEHEILEYANFFLQRRMRSGGFIPAEKTRQILSGETR